jgi:hypothetical protein
MSVCDQVTEAQEPEWILNRDTVMNDKLYLTGYRFSGDLTGIRVPLSAVSPVNAAARAWSPRQSVMAHPRYRAARRVVVNNRVVHVGRYFFSDQWPPKDEGWIAANPSAEAVVQYRNEHADELPHLAWDVDAARVNTIEADAARRAPPAPPEDPRPEYPMSGPIPKGAIGFRPRRDQPSNFTPSTSPSSVNFPPRTFVRPR